MSFIMDYAMQVYLTITILSKECSWMLGLLHTTPARWKSRLISQNVQQFALEALLPSKPCLNRLTLGLLDNPSMRIRAASSSRRDLNSVGDARRFGPSSSETRVLVDPYLERPGELGGAESTSEPIDSD